MIYLVIASGFTQNYIIDRKFRFKDHQRVLIEATFSVS